MSKKTRGPNFSSNEKEILINLVTKYKDVVENKKTDAVTTASKNEGWKKLTTEFNSLSSFSVRNTDQLKTCWDNIKRNTRKDKARTKKEIMLTGGGRPNLPPPGPFQGQVEVLLGPTLNGLENPFDSDAQYSHQQDDAVTIENEIEIIENNDMMQLRRLSQLEEDGLQLLVSENDSTANPTVEPTAGPSTLSKSDECSEIVHEDKDRKMWVGWSPAALKSKVSNNLAIKKNDSPSWLQRRRPKASLHDSVLKSKLELLEIMKKAAESEAAIKKSILEEQLKQEKIKTEKLLLELKEAQQNNRF